MMAGKGFQSLLDADLREVIVARLYRGLASAVSDREAAICGGWAYAGERKILALRETEWEKSVKRAKRLSAEN
jgi:hypothetical protein